MKADEVRARVADLAPANEIMAVMWAGSLQYCIGRSDMLAAFRAETGLTWSPGRTAIESMIDEATGAAADFILQFAKWHNKNIWGEDEHGRPIDAPCPPGGQAPCQTCDGKGFVNPDGSKNNAFEGSDVGPFLPCPACATTRKEM
jgi:hypothetical protein